MFYVEIKRPIHLKGEQQELYAKIEQKTGVKSGIHLVKSGVIEGENGEAQYWDYFQLFENLPTFRGHWDDMSPIQKIENKEFITIDLYLENGLLLQRDVTMELHEVNYLPDEEGGGYLLLCSNKDFYFQVIAS